MKYLLKMCLTYTKNYSTKLHSVLCVLCFFHGCRKRRLRFNSIYTWDRLRSDGVRLTISHKCSISHSCAILIKYVGISEDLRCLCYPFGDKTWLKVLSMMYHEWMTYPTTLTHTPCLTGSTVVYHQLTINSEAHWVRGKVKTIRKLTSNLIRKKLKDEY
jgi:hypothetical protein